MTSAPPSTFVPAFEAWAIYQPSTGKFLPMRWTTARGYTHDEPSFDFPRLLRSERGAKQALRAWLQGEWVEACTFDEYSTCYESTGPEPSLPRPERYNYGMEVVKFMLKINE